ncbi:MAG: UDP-N-acetylmuramate--L-alanine ligase [Candidatus Falkowbacteria bacterium]
MDLNKVKLAYFIGIKGVGMTMLAEFLANLGVQIAGSDVDEPFITDAVIAKIGARVNIGFKAENIPADADLIIYSTAYNDNNPEVAAAKASGRMTLTYAEAMAKVFNYRYGIAVCGSHGKTTVTAWLGYVLDKAGLKPSVMVGSTVPQFGGAGLYGESDYLVIEADEYQNKLQYFEPKAVLLNNIDFDHPDFYPDLASYEDVFAKFVAKIPVKGWLVANFSDQTIKRVAVGLKCRVVSYGLADSGADLVASELAVQAGKQYFRVTMNGDDLGVFNCQLVGQHNVLNAMAVIAAALELGVELLALRQALADFSGTTRRLEFRGEYQGARLYDDYAHHPTEIKATISALRDLFPERKLVVVFHPHTFTRTKALFADFAAALSLVDRLALLDIFGSAREQQGGVSSTELLEAVHRLKPELPAELVSTVGEVPAWLKANLQGGEIVVLMGAGDIFRAADAVLAE